MAHHRDIDQAIFRQHGVLVQEYVLDPFNPKDPGQWAYQHQNMHSAVNAVLGLSGFDLTEVDWTRQDQLAGFIQSNADEHVSWATLLELG